MDLIVLFPIAVMASIQWVSGIPDPTHFVTAPISDELGGSFSDLLEAYREILLNGLHIPVFGVLAWLWRPVAW